jgi:hypothetical protein
VSVSLRTVVSLERPCGLFDRATDHAKLEKAAPEAVFLLLRMPSAPVSKAMWKAFTVLLTSLLSAAAYAQERGRIKRPPPYEAEAGPITPEMAMNDGLLQKGDIVVTERAFRFFADRPSDGVTDEFARVLNPASVGKPGATSDGKPFHM